MNTDRLDKIVARHAHVLLLLQGLVLEGVDFDDEATALIRESAESVIRKTSKKISDDLEDPEWRHSSIENELEFSTSLFRQGKREETFLFLEECVELVSPKVVPRHYFKLQSLYWLLQRYDEAIDVMNRLGDRIEKGVEIEGFHSKESLQRIIQDGIERSRGMKARPENYKGFQLRQTLRNLENPLNE